MSFKLSRTKAIKTLGSGVAWASVLDNIQPVHLLSVYHASQNPKFTNETIDRLLISVDNVLARALSSTFIIAGKLNEQRPLEQRKLLVRGFKAVIPKATP